MIELIGVIIGAISLWIAYRSYVIAHIEPLQEKREYLIGRFDYGKELTMALKERLFSFVKTHNILDEVFVQGLTYKQCIEILDDYLLKVFTIEAQAELTRSKLWSQSHEKFQETLEDTIKNLHSINVALDRRFER